MSEASAEFWTRAGQQFQQMAQNLWALPGPSVTAAPAISFSPAKLQEAQRQYIDALESLNKQGWQSLAQQDSRFKAEAWRSNLFSGFAAAAYLLQAKTLLALADAVEGDAKTRKRIRFAVEQWIAAAAPSNFLAFNAEAQATALESRGESIARGVCNLLHDLQQGRVSMTDESRFEVGRNVATTEGAVVFENELFQLIEYKPLTAKVFERPLLLVPPCINKYYIMDLRPENSLVRYAVSKGHRTFMVSWRNPDAELADRTWDDYIDQGVIEATRVAREITQAEQINALGFCVGGTLLGCALAVQAARGEASVASATFLTTLLDFSDTGVLDVFIDEASVRMRELQMGNGGLLRGRELATTFNFLRPNDLVWNYVVGNYLKGEAPPPFDLLYWNGDATNLPGPFYAWYLRNTYLENNLVKPGKVSVCGEPIDLGRIDLPVYIYGSREDHIVPAASAYSSTRLLPGRKRFVLGASGHIAGVINPPAAGKRSHWVREDGQFPAELDVWLAGAKECPGSWWTDWSAWLTGQAGRQIASPKRYGRGAAYRAIEPAPGRYVKVRLDG